MNILHALRRWLPDWITPDPSVADIISRFRQVQNDLKEAQAHYAAKADNARRAAEALQAQANSMKSESDSAARIADRLNALFS